MQLLNKLFAASNGKTINNRDDERKIKGNEEQRMEDIKVTFCVMHLIQLNELNFSSPVDQNECRMLNGK